MADEKQLRYDGNCSWCAQVGTIKGHEIYNNFITSGPDDKPLHIPYDEVCVSCWTDIREQWEQSGELSKPLSAYNSQPEESDAR